MLKMKHIGRALAQEARQERAAWLAQPRRCAAMLALALAVSPALSALSVVPGLQVSLSAGGLSNRLVGRCEA
jgi:hypothetical protein